MAQCRQTAQEFVKNAFAPMVAVVSSHDAELVCQKNNLSFVELIQPFCRLTTEAHVKDPSNIPHPCSNLQITVRDMTVYPPQPTLAKKLLSEAVSDSQPPIENSRNNIQTVGDYDLQLSQSTPWYEAYRDTYLRVAFPSDHEFLKHFLACVFVVSSSNADPIDQFSRLTQQQHLQQHQQPNKLPKWFCPNILRYYVLVHDVVDEDLAKAESIYQVMKTQYGNDNCHLLQINSKKIQPNDPVLQEKGILPLPDPWSQFLNKKTENFDSDFDTGQQLPSVDNSGFPNRVTEGTPKEGEDRENVEAATEVTEDPDQSMTSSMVIDHPLAADGDSFSNAINSNNDTEISLQRDQENNPIGPNNGPNKSSQHGACLTLSDHDRLRIFIQEFVKRGLIPWAEKTLRVLNEQLTSRKGIHRSFFSATKKWFGGNKPAGPASMTEKANVVYTPEAPEMQMRRMADLAFMFQLYEIAYQTYHTLKRDFNNDHAWLYLAGALEMACIAVFMQGNLSQRQYPSHYMESSITTYAHTCKNPQFATRATFLSTESLKSKGMYAEAATQFIKMTSEDSDLRSALLLEQAAHCFIHTKVPMVRKYAFHMILAGHRFSKAGQRKHALRAYSQALQVYKGKDWTLAEDHINFTIGRQSFNLKQLENATAAFKHVLTVNSRQAALQQSAFLREYIFVYKQQLAQMSPDSPTAKTLPQLPLPVVDGNATKVLLCNPHLEKMDTEDGVSLVFDSDDSDIATWQKLEELVIVSNQKCIPLGHKMSIHCLTNRTNNSSSPIGIQAETIYLQVHLVNPLKIPLVLTDVMLLWKFLPVNFENESPAEKMPEMITNETVDNIKNNMADEMIKTQVLEEVTIEGHEHKMVYLALTPHHTGELHIDGVAYNLGTSSQNTSNQNQANNQATKPSFISSISVKGKQNLEVQGPRLNSTKDEKTSKMYGPDRRLDLLVTSPMPRLQVEFMDFPEHLLCGELKLVTVNFKNSGKFPLVNVKTATTNPNFFTFGKHSGQDMCNIYEVIENSQSENEEIIVNEKEIKHVIEVPIPGQRLDPGMSVSVPMWIRGPDTAGRHEVKFLFLYESTRKNSKLSHRTLRHTATVEVSNSICLTANAHRTPKCSNDTPSGEEDQLNTVTISLEIENMNQLHDSSIAEFKILQVSCASCQWHLHHQSTELDSEIKVCSRESFLMSLKAARCQNCGVTDGKTIFTNVAFGKQKINSASSPCSDFYFHSKPFVKFEDLEVLPVNPALYQAPKDIVTAETLFRDLNQALAVDLTLIVLWQAFVVDDSGTSRVITGQHHVTVNKINNPVSMPVQMKHPVEQPPVKIIKNPDSEKPLVPHSDVISQLLKYSMVFEHIVTHNFEKTRLCLVPVTVKLHNCTRTQVSVEIITTQQRRDGKTGTQNSPVLQDTPSDKYSWTGNTSLQANIQSGESLSIPLKACFFNPGVYNLGTLQVLAKPVENIGDIVHEQILQKSSSSSLIVIKKS